MLRHIALSLAIVLTIQLAFGFKAVLFSIVSSIMCMLMIETVNYVEHYGLLRKKDEKGVYEPVNIKHSWNAPQVITNHMLFKLQRHSDHHANVYKPYQILESLSDSPELPHGYSASVILAMLPSEWFKMANPLAEATNRGEKISP
jgi:alkane 1-monooxygenase